MADHHRSTKKELVQQQLEQEALLDDPNFLKEIVQKALQRILEAEMTAHIGPLPTSAQRTARDIATATRKGP